MPDSATPYRSRPVLYRPHRNLSIFGLSGSDHNRRQTNAYAKENPSRTRRFHSLSRLQLTLHATRRNTSRRRVALEVQAISAWSLKARRVSVPALQGCCRDARVYGRTTVAMHNMRSPPPRLSKREDGPTPPEKDYRGMLARNLTLVLNLRS